MHSFSVSLFRFSVSSLLYSSFSVSLASSCIFSSSFFCVESSTLFSSCSLAFYSFSAFLFLNSFLTLLDRVYEWHNNLEMTKKMQY